MTKRMLLTIAAVALLLCTRGALISVSRGSNDLRTWRVYSDYVSHYDLLSAYSRFTTLGPKESVFNHGPIAAAIGSYTMRSRALLGSFHVSFRAVCLLGSVAALAVIGVMSAQPLLSLLLYLLCPVSLFVEGFHGNTDPVAAGLLMIGLLVGSRPQGDLLRGFCFGLALLAKPISIIAVIPLLAVSWRERCVARTLLGFGFGALPLAVVHALEPQSIANVWLYRSNPEPWGSRFLPHSWEPFRSSSFLCLFLPSAYSVGVAFGWFKVSLAEALATVWLLFLICVPGIGVQYFIYPLAPLLIAAPRLGGAYGAATGIFVTLVYWTFLSRNIAGSIRVPFETSHQPMKDFSHLVVSAQLTWSTLVIITAGLLVRQRRSAQPVADEVAAEADVTPCVSSEGMPRR